MSVNSKLPPNVKELIYNTKIVIIITNNKFIIFINMENTNNSQIYDMLVSIVNGDKYTLNELKDVDELINGFKFNPKYPGNSMIILYFDSEEDYWNLFDLTDDDIWFANNVMSYYSDYEFDSEDSIQYDWNEGYIIRNFNNDNLNTILSIFKLIGFYKNNDDSDDYFSNGAKLLGDIYNNEVSSIVWEYANEMNICKKRGAIDMITSDSCEVFQKYGIFRKTCFTTYLTTVSTLLRLYKMVGNTSLTITEVLEKIATDNIDISGWSEYAYEVECIDFDDESFNRSVERQLEKIMDKITDNDDIIDKQKFISDVSQFLDKYNFDSWYETPKDSQRQFKISNIDTEKQLIIISTRKYGYQHERRSYSVDEFNTFLHQPELFEQKKFRKLK